MKFKGKITDLLKTLSSSPIFSVRVTVGRVPISGSLWMRCGVNPGQVTYMWQGITETHSHLRRRSSRDSHLRWKNLSTGKLLEVYSVKKTLWICRKDEDHWNESKTYKVKCLLQAIWITHRVNMTSCSYDENLWWQYYAVVTLFFKRETWS